jgi:hypothetical protein
MDNQVDFTSLGFDPYDNDFLNWCLKNRYNLQFIRECKTLERQSSQIVIHSDHEKIVQRIDDIVIHKR